jgi:hypothetical protein
MEEMKWLATILLIALVHMLHVPVMENAVNALHITAEAGRYRGVSLPSPVKGHTIDPLRISITIIK